MTTEALQGIVAFLQHAERLKAVTRTAWTSEGQRESVAAHTWRLCLMAMLLEREFENIDVARLIKMCMVHDLGEAIAGDISAVLQQGAPSKADQERADLQTLLEPLPEPLGGDILDLWDDYEAAASGEAKLAKALDKLETIMQHNQGQNPEDFDYAFNLDYGRQYTGGHPIITALRHLLDGDTAAHAARRL